MSGGGDGGEIIHPRQERSLLERTSRASILSDLFLERPGQLRAPIVDWLESSEEETENRRLFANSKIPALSAGESSYSFHSELMNSCSGVFSKERSYKLLFVVYIFSSG